MSAPLARFRWKLILFVGMALISGLRAEVSLPAIFGSHMVLQRERLIPVWGKAAPGEAVTVEFAGIRTATTADAAGDWRVRLPAQSASAEGRPLIVRGTNTLTLEDVLVGEVWFCSGQSNMEKQLGPRRGQQPTDNYEAETAAANHPLLRLFQIPLSGKPKEGIPTWQWLPCTPENVAKSEFSAAGYFFGRDVLQKLGVPIGMIHGSYGGTRIEAWLPRSAFETTPGLEVLLDAPYKAWVKGVQATELYQSMVAPIIPFALRGFLWYQGEANLMEGESTSYALKLRTLIGAWRSAWELPDAAFYFVQLAPFNYSKWESFPKPLTPVALPAFREAQRAALDLPNTGTISTLDLVANIKDIHPTNKRDVGGRLARLALARTYGIDDLVVGGPEVERFVVRPDGVVELTFRSTGALRTRDGAPASGFVMAGADRIFHPTTVTLSGRTALISSADVPSPAAVRFAWHEEARPNLTDDSGLPAEPFRSDRWPLTLERPPAPKPAEPAEPAKTTP